MAAVLKPFINDNAKIVRRYNSAFLYGTREWALQKFDKWMLPERKRHRLFVLVADAGVGKIAGMCRLAPEQSGIVFACHFFQHNDSRRKNAKRMLLSIVCQLCQRIPDFKTKIMQHIAAQQLDYAKLTGPDYSATALFVELLHGPALAVSPPAQGGIILIDALDKVADSGMDSGTSDLVKCIERHFDKLPIWLNVCLST